MKTRDALHRPNDQFVSSLSAKLTHGGIYRWTPSSVLADGKARVSRSGGETT